MRMRKNHSALKTVAQIVTCRGAENRTRTSRTRSVYTATILRPDGGPTGSRTPASSMPWTRNTALL